jgi:4-hydroxybenzoate polyprenyltransferase
MKRLADWLSMVKFSHSIFALPFAFQGAWLAADGVPAWRTLGWILVCAVAARTAALAFNRFADRRIDAENPRTSGREIPSGRVTPRSALALTLVAALAFIAAAFRLGPLPGWLSLPVLAVLLGYSLVKRFSVLAHAVLGVALAIAPLGAWVAVRGEIGSGIAPVLWLALAVWSWVTGFDLIYACQDADFDTERELHSVPARLGVPFALRASAVLHAVTMGALIMVGVRANLGWIYALSVAGAALLLLWEHRIVRPDDLSRVDMGFFTLNGWVGVALFLGLVADMGWIGGSA